MRSKARNQTHHERPQTDLDKCLQLNGDLEIRCQVYKFGDSGIFKFVVPKVKNLTNPKKKKQKEKEKLTRFPSSIARSKNTVKEIALCNDWDYFVTFTFSPDTKHRYNFDWCYKQITQFIRDERKRTKNSIRYLLIPEKHKDGACHFHGLIYDCEECLRINEHNYLEFSRYRDKYGFTNLQRILTKDNESKLKVSNYISKYITKEFEDKEIYKHFYYACHGLRRKEKFNEISVSYEELKEFYESDFCFTKWITDERIEKNDN